MCKTSMSKIDETHMKDTKVDWNKLIHLTFGLEDSVCKVANSLSAK